MIIGIDLDNTIISYEALLFQCAREYGYIGSNAIDNRKSEIRDIIRSLPDGEMKWRQVQSEIYGTRLMEAKLYPGTIDFLKRAVEEFPVYIISHKTQFSAIGRVELRKAAEKFLEMHGFFNPQGVGLKKESLSFHDTRQEKIQAIKAVGCTHFIDDLEEVFNDSEFPGYVNKILFKPNQDGIDKDVGKPSNEIILADSWSQLYSHFF